MILVIDNYDSFTYNLVQFIGELGAEPSVWRNDAITAAEVASQGARGIVISPGPCTPREAGVSVEVIKRLSGAVPILGVCLGHQAIGAAFGGTIGRVLPMHGKSTLIFHGGGELFAGLPSPFPAGRYHSLVVEREGLPEELEVTARSEDGLIMGLIHRSHPTYGVQFHPESILTPGGKGLLKNFLQLAGEI